MCANKNQYKSRIFISLTIIYLIHSIAVSKIVVKYFYFEISNLLKISF
jgi:hypothetical protein